MQHIFDENGITYSPNMESTTHNLSMRTIEHSPEKQRKWWKTHAIDKLPPLSQDHDHGRRKKTDRQMISPWSKISVNGMNGVRTMFLFSAHFSNYCVCESNATCNENEEATHKNIIWFSQNAKCIDITWSRACVRVCLVTAVAASVTKSSEKESVACQIMMFHAFIEFSLSPYHQFVCFFSLRSSLSTLFLHASVLFRPHSSGFFRLLFVVAFVREGSRVLCALFFGNWSQCKHLAIPSALMLRALWRSIWFGNCSTTNVSGSIDTNWPRRIRVFAWTLWLCKWNSAFRPKRQQLLEFTANKWQQHQFRRKIGTDGTHEVHVHNGRHPERH